MEAARGLSPEQAGLVLLPMGAVAAFVSHPVSRRNLVRGPLIACAFFMLLASVATLFITGHSPVIALVGVMVLFGVVVGTTSVGNQTALYLQSPPENVGTASGLSRTFGYIGSIASATITSIVFHARVSDAGLHDMALILVGVAAVVLLMTLLDRQLPRGSTALSSAAPRSPGPKGDAAQASGRGEPAVRTAVATASAGPVLIRQSGGGRPARAEHGIEILVHHGHREVRELDVVVAGVLSQRVERRLHGHPVALGEHAFGLLDHDPAVERALQMLGQHGGALSGALLQDADRGHVRECLRQPLVLRGHRAGAPRRTG